MSGKKMPPKFAQELGVEPEANGHGRYPREAASFHRTEMGNAERLISFHGDDLRYVYPWRRWLVWDDTRWKPDTSGEVERRARETVRAIYAEAAAADDKDESRAIARHAMTSEARSKIDAMIALARSMVPVAPDDLDADPWLLNVENGTIDLRTGELREHRREDLITRVAPVGYDPEAQAPRFGRFLREIFDGDEDLIGFVRRFAGYSLAGSTRERVFAILHGRGKNGKSTLVELLQDAMGDYATTTDAETILAKRYQGVGNDVAALKGARMVATAEVERGRALAESKVKHLTGSDTVTARFLYGEPFSFRPEFKLWLSTNNKPVIKGSDDAIWDRIRLVPFDQRFEGGSADPQLPEKLRAELPGVLAWMVEGCMEWQRGGLGDPERVRQASEGYRDEMDVLARFIEDRCVEGADLWVKMADLYPAYQEWCDESGEKAEKKLDFGNRLKERGFEPDRGTGNAPIRRGIGLRDDRNPDPEGGSRVTQEPESYPAENGDNPHGNGENGEQSYHSYPESHDSRLNPSHEGTSMNQGNSGNSGNSGGPSGGGVKPRMKPHATTPHVGDRLTPEQAEQVKRLIHEGMSPKYARAEVLGEKPL